MCAYKKTECKTSKLTGHELFLIGGKRVLPSDPRSRELQYGNGIHGFLHPSNRTVQQHGHDHTAIALAYIEIELQHHPVRLLSEERKEAAAYIGKAFSFVRKMQKCLSTTQVPPLSSIRTSANKTTEVLASPLQWTSNAIDLVELIYGINEMGCINNGEMPLKQLAPLLYQIFGIEAKDCYRFYIDIKRRKNESRTYFLDRMQEKLNRKILHDEELERMRR